MGKEDGLAGEGVARRHGQARLAERQPLRVKRELVPAPFGEGHGGEADLAKPMNKSLHR